MPQFDISSFIVQLVWLFFSFLYFYFVFSWKYLPSWAFLIKTRKKLESSENLQNPKFEFYTLNKTKDKNSSLLPTKNRLYF